jgi:hypothetical protein
MPYARSVAALSALAVSVSVLIAGCGDPWWESPGYEYKSRTRSEQSAFDAAGSGAWEARPSIPSPNLAQTAVIAPSGRLYVVGGATSQAYRFDPNAAAGQGAWEQLPNLPEPRFDALATVVGTQVIVASGVGSNGAVSFVESLDDAAATPVWRRIPTPFKRTQAAVVGTGTRLYVIGGHDGNGGATREIFELDPVTATSVATDWKTLGQLVTPRTLASGFVIGTKLHVIGGQGGNSVALGTEDVIDLVARTVSPTAAPIPTARIDPQVVFLGGRAYVFDSRTFAVAPTARLDSYSDAERWVSHPSIPNPLLGQAMAPAGGRLLVAGGLGSRKSDTVTYLFDPATNAWSAGPDMPIARHAGFLADFGVRTNYVGGIETKRKEKQRDWKDYVF